MGIVDNLKDIASVVQQADNIDLYRKALDAQKDAMELVDENRRLKEDKRALEEALRVKESLSFEKNAYWMKSTAPPENGPYCSACWDAKKTLVHLHANNNPQYHECPSCEKLVNTSGRPDDPRPRPKILAI